MGGVAAYGESIYEILIIDRMRYLYGASIQGIQSFIFETNKLQEIAGASELVEYVCTEFFIDRVNEIEKFREENLIIGAAGNIKYIFDSRSTCEAVVYDFPYLVMQRLPGVTISQAIVEIPDDLKKDSIQELEDKLRTQRNRQVTFQEAGWMVSERARRTGRPGRHWDKGVVISDSQHQKRKAGKPPKDRLLKKILPKDYQVDVRQYPFDMEDLTAGRERGWIAVVHADGNNLGKKLIELSDKLVEKDIQAAFRELSQTLEDATVAAASNAVDDILQSPSLSRRHKLPIRPVILGGDDLTVIIDGKYAVQFTQAFLYYFEKFTREKFSYFEGKYGSNVFRNGLTACAGIAFVKDNYPFHYAVRLSDILCAEAKKVSKSISGSPSSLMFHKVHSSFVEDYSQIVERELTTRSYQLNFGPYFLKKQEGYASIDQLREWVNITSEKNAPAAPIRNWLNELETNEERAEMIMDRIIQLNKKYKDSLGLGKYVSKNFNGQNKRFTHLYDVINLLAVQ